MGGLGIPSPTTLEFRHIQFDPTVNGAVRNIDAPLGKHFDEVSVIQPKVRYQRAHINSGGLVALFTPCLSSKHMCKEISNLTGSDRSHT